MQWVCWPLLCIGVGLLVWRIADGAGGASIVWSSLQVLLWSWLLVSNHSARRKHRQT
ncbi:hypothetical protein [Streptomyces sp. NPDC005302]|uniref:hypothetical protein n=1 Tax=Streptomyces sp. NPDC005302 TaxID=3154675 RepID=UPI0033B60696